jgi:hypothetical protein
MIKSIKNYLKYNNSKFMTVQIYFWTAVYRLCIIFVPMPKLEKKLGERGEESPGEESIDNLRIAKRVGLNVVRVASHTPWESKCLVRAMTARKLLMKKHISSTLYLGVGKDNDQMIAHAWLRCGNMYVTGGDGKNYSMVAKFRTQF